MVTINLGRDASIREITVECATPTTPSASPSALGGLEGVRVLWHHDRALMRHEGGKLDDRARPCAWRRCRTMRDVYTPGVARVCMAIAEDPALAARSR